VLSAREPGRWIMVNEGKCRQGQKEKAWNTQRHVANVAKCASKTQDAFRVEIPLW
jgi:hypothetical protein